MLSPPLHSPSEPPSPAEPLFVRHRWRSQSHQRRPDPLHLLPLSIPRFPLSSPETPPPGPPPDHPHAGDLALPLPPADPPAPRLRSAPLPLPQLGLKSFRF